MPLQIGAKKLSWAQTIGVIAVLLVAFVGVGGILALIDPGPTNPSFNFPDEIVKKCQATAEGEFTRPVTVSLDYSHNMADDNTWLQGFDAKTLNQYDIAVKYRGVCVAESDGQGRVKMHISMLKQVVE
jgi:hypothetical protein